MPTAHLPTRLQLTDGALAMDGGSLFLEAMDQAGARVRLRLDCSVRAQQESTTQLYVEDVVVARGSPEEAAWLALVRDAEVQRSSGSRSAKGPRLAANYVVLADDVAGYFEAMQGGPDAALSWLAARLVALVSSAAYQEGRAAPSSTPPQEDIRSLVRQGELWKAIVAYRRAHPDVGVTAARAIVKALAAEGQEEPPGSSDAGTSAVRARRSSYP